MVGGAVDVLTHHSGGDDGALAELAADSVHGAFQLFPALPPGGGLGQEEIHLLRRLVPLECERLQGYPDGWTDVPGASDSARYKALGNSVAIPCVEYLMERVALVIALGLEWRL